VEVEIEPCLMCGLGVPKLTLCVVVGRKPHFWTKKAAYDASTTASSTSMIGMSS